MAAPSEAFAWKLFPGIPHVCWECGRDLKRREDVAEHRRKYPGGKDQFRCVDCSVKRREEMVERNRRALGLQV